MTLIDELSNHYYVAGTTDTDELIAKTIARIRELEADLAHKEAYYAQFDLVPKATLETEVAK